MKLMVMKDMMDIYIVLKKIDEIQEILIAERDNETNLVHNITEELILLVSLIIVYVLCDCVRYNWS